MKLGVNVSEIYLVESKVARRDVSRSNVTFWDWEESG